MSANNQMLVKKYKGKYYVFEVMAESWSKTNPLSVKNAIKSFNTFDDAYQFSQQHDAKQDWQGQTEYGSGTRLIKDGADVKIVK